MRMMYTFSVSMSENIMAILQVAYIPFFILMVILPPFGIIAKATRSAGPILASRPPPAP